MDTSMKMSQDHWSSVGQLSPRPFICGYCGKDVGAHKGYHNSHGSAYIYICPNCGCPTLFQSNTQIPGPMIGRDIAGLNEDTAAVYKEMRNSAKDGNNTAVVMLGRKLIMHIAVEAGADEGKTFAEYVTYLSQQHYTPPNAAPLLDYMRKLGNEKNHEIKLGTAEEAQKIIKFVEALLYFVYELKNEFSDIAGSRES